MFLKIIVSFVLTGPLGNLIIKSKKRDDLFRSKLRLSSDLLAAKLTWRKPFWYFIFSFLDKKKMTVSINHSINN